MLTLGTELRKLGWDVAICTGGEVGERANVGRGERPAGAVDAPVAADYERAAITHYRASIPYSPHRPRDLPQLIRLPLAMWQVVRAIRRFHPSLVHSHSRQMGAYARLAQLVLGVPFVSTMHSPFAPRNRLWAAATFLGSRMIAVSTEIQASLVRDYRVAEDRVRVVTPGADADHFRPPTSEEREAAQRRWGIEPGQLVLAFVGSLNPNKRPDTLVDAVASLTDAGENVVALIAGRGSEEEAIRSRATALGIAERVRLLGYQDARSVLWASDVLVLPSLIEGFGLVLVEAMLSGVVVMCTSSAASQEVTPDFTGVVFEYGNHADLARRIADLIELPDVRRRMADRALEDARTRFTSTAMARSIEATYLDVLNDPRR